MEQVIFHVDVNSAYLSWEAVYRLKHRGETVDLRRIPSAVGGDVNQRHGIILAKSIPAGRYKIRTGDSIWEARQKYRNLTIVPPDYGLYDRCSRALLDILREFSPAVEQYSIDEAYMDMSGTEKLFGKPEEAADRIRERIRRELGFTVNIGISQNKLLAKMASDFRKPDRTHTLFMEEIPEKLWPLPVTELFFVGRATAEKLAKLGIYTVGSLAKADVEILKTHLKKQGQLIWDFANGRDFSLVEAVPPQNKGYGNSTTMAMDVTKASQAKLVLLALAETVGARLRKDNKQAEVLSVSIRDYQFRTCSRQCCLPNPTHITEEIHRHACRLFDEVWDGTAIRHLGIHTGRITEWNAHRQAELFDNRDYEKLEKWECAVDSIRGRFGMDAVKRAVFIQCPVDHMSGGMSREKRYRVREKAGKERI